MLDKWFALQALAQRADTVDEVERCPDIPISRIAQPEPPALAGRQLRRQPVGVPRCRSGRGYRFLADMILAVDKLNPQIAARLVPPLGRWRRFEPGRAALMRGELERIVADAGPVARTCSSRSSKSLA